MFGKWTHRIAILQFVFIMIQFFYIIYTHIYVDILCIENRNRDYEKVCKQMSC